MGAEKRVVLVVDDTSLNLALVSNLLKDKFKVKVALNGQQALAIAAATPPDLILLDIMMPEMDGYETCQRLKADEQLKNIPVIFLTAKNQPEDEEKGLELGAVDYITKPISPPILMARVKTHMNLKLARDLLQNRNAFMEAEIARRLAEIALIQDVSILALASLAETRDNETGAHIRRTQQYVKELAEDLCRHEQFADFLTPDNIQMLTKSAPLHDIGKVGIPDHILLKPGRLTEEEFDIMKLHTVKGRDALVRAEILMNKPDTFLHIAKELVNYHHEKWDGTGYPEGLAGESIPIAARLMALADVYDALISKRVYKEAFPHEQAVAFIAEGKGKHFDPAVVEAFLRLEKRFKAIADKLPDNQEK